MGISLRAHLPVRIYLAPGDLLTSYDGKSITYDTIGNPLSDGTRTFEWKHGRQLASLTKDGVTWTYTYDANGMRTSRSNGTITYKYVYNGDKLSQMTILTKNADNTVTEEIVNLAYDASGLPFTLTYIPDGEETGTTYYYITNIQGDVVGLTDSEGTLLISYSYEAYGEGYYSSYSTQSALLARINPLCYRGYVYDTGTNLYYLQSRYYDPTLGRFLNADAAIGQTGNVKGHNMFAYAFNNPLAYSDSTGNWPKASSIFLGIAMVAAVVAAVALTVVTYGTAAPAMAVAVSSIATTAYQVAIAATVVGAAALAQEEIAKQTGTKNHSVYVLKDSKGTVQYVGRTVNVRARASAHAANPAREDLEMEVVATGLSRLEARALEQAGMIYHHTINKANPRNNQINGIAPMLWTPFYAIASGTINYTWNLLTNEILYWAGC